MIGKPPLFFVSLLATALIVLAACAGGRSSPTNSNPVAGDFGVAMLAGQPVADRTAVAVSIDPAAAALSITTSCNEHLGSYTATETGILSITLTGGTQAECSATETEWDRYVVGIFGQANRWEQTTGGLTLSTADGTIVLVAS